MVNYVLVQSCCRFVLVIHVNTVKQPLSSLHSPSSEMNKRMMKSASSRSNYEHMHNWVYLT